jgi:hypothetical protein
MQYVATASGFNPIIFLNCEIKEVVDEEVKSGMEQEKGQTCSKYFK